MYHCRSNTYSTMDLSIAKRFCNVWITGSKKQNTIKLYVCIHIFTLETYLFTIKSNLLNLPPTVWFVTYFTSNVNMIVGLDVHAYFD